MVFWPARIWLPTISTGMFHTFKFYFYHFKIGSQSVCSQNWLWTQSNPPTKCWDHRQEQPYLGSFLFLIGGYWLFKQLDHSARWCSFTHVSWVLWHRWPAVLIIIGNISSIISSTIFSISFLLILLILVINDAMSSSSSSGVLATENCPTALWCSLTVPSGSPSVLCLGAFCCFSFKAHSSSSSVL